MTTVPERDHPEGYACSHTTLVLAGVQALSDYLLGFATLVASDMVVTDLGGALKVAIHVCESINAAVEQYVRTHSDDGFTLPVIDARTLLRPY